MANLPKYTEPRVKNTQELRFFKARMGSRRQPPLSRKLIGDCTQHWPQECKEALQEKEYWMEVPAIVERDRQFNRNVLGWEE